MSRTLTVAMGTAVARPFGESCHLIELQLSTGTRRYTTASHDLSWNAVTWTAIGGEVVLSPVDEVADLAAPGCEITFAGVDTTLLTAVRGANYLGRTCRVYFAGIDPTTRLVIADPVLAFAGLMNGGWTASEQRTAEGGTATLTGRLTHRIAAMQERHGIQCNMGSHQGYYPEDMFFRQGTEAASRPVTLDWGKK